MNDPSKRNVYIGAALCSLLVALGIGQAVLDKRRRAQGTPVQAPRFEVDPLWPKPLPNHWLLGSTIGVWVDEQDHIWIIHRGAATCTTTRWARSSNPPIAECCAARRRCSVRSGRQPGAHLGRPGRGLRVARVEPRHPRRPQGQRLDRRQRREGRAHPEVHEGRQVPDAGRRARQERGQQRSRRTSAASRRSWSIRRPTRPTSPTATATSASPCSTPTPAR